jgi:hypothetical protein
MTTIVINDDSRIDDLRGGQWPHAVLMEATAECASQETLEETSAETWHAVLSALLAGWSFAQASLPEDSVVKPRGVTWLWRCSLPTTRTGPMPLRQTSCFAIGLVPFREDQHSLDDHDFASTQWPGRGTTAETAPPAGSQSITWWLAAGNEVALTTPTVEQQDSGPHLTVWTITDCEVEDEGDSTPVVLSIEETAHATPR